MGLPKLPNTGIPVGRAPQKVNGRVNDWTEPTSRARGSPTKRLTYITVRAVAFQENCGGCKPYANEIILECWNIGVMEYWDGKQSIIIIL